MSKCREEFEKWFNSDSKDNYWHTWQAAWNARGEVDKRIVRDNGCFKIQPGSPHRRIFEEVKEAIEQEIEK